MYGNKEEIKLVLFINLYLPSPKELQDINWKIETGYVLDRYNEGWLSQWLHNKSNLPHINSNEKLSKNLSEDKIYLTILLTYGRFWLEKLVVNSKYYFEYSQNIDYKRSMLGTF